MIRKVMFVFTNDRVEGKVIERTESGEFMLNEYNREGIRIFNPNLKSPLNKQNFDSIMKESRLVDRVKKLLHFFPDADYISDSAIFALKGNSDEYIELTLNHVVDFSKYI